VSEHTFTQERATVLVVEDDPAMMVALRDILEGGGYNVVTASDGRSALQALEAEVPALILSDISMPVMDGIELFESVRKDQRGAGIPVIFLTARGQREDIFAGKSIGVDDYITKPVTAQEVLAAVQARLVRSHELEMIQFQKAYRDTLRVLANAIERGTADHVERVNAYAQAVAEELGWDHERRDALELGAILHDIGKIRVPEAILSKPGPLTDEEWRRASIRKTASGWSPASPTWLRRFRSSSPITSAGTARATHRGWRGRRSRRMPGCYPLSTLSTP
jgi:putative two-component system response regulator